MFFVIIVNTFITSSQQIPFKTKIYKYKSFHHLSSALPATLATIVKPDSICLRCFKPTPHNPKYSGIQKYQERKKGRNWLKQTGMGWGGKKQTIKQKIVFCFFDDKFSLLPGVQVPPLDQNSVKHSQTDTHDKDLT